MNMRVLVLSGGLFLALNSSYAMDLGKFSTEELSEKTLLSFTADFQAYCCGFVSTPPASDHFSMCQKYALLSWYQQKFPHLTSQNKKLRILLGLDYSSNP